MRFLVDAQLPPALARLFGEQGLPATPVREVGLRESDDGSIWDFAKAGGLTVVTKDEDFVARCVGDAASPPVVWLRIGNCTNRVLFVWLQPFLVDIKSRLSQGEKIIEVRQAP